MSSSVALVGDSRFSRNSADSGGVSLRESDPKLGEGADGLKEWLWLGGFQELPVTFRAYIESLVRVNHERVHNLAGVLFSRVAFATMLICGRGY